MTDVPEPRPPVLSGENLPPLWTLRVTLPDGIVAAFAAPCGGELQLRLSTDGVPGVGTPAGGLRLTLPDQTEVTISVWASNIEDPLLAVAAVESLLESFAIAGDGPYPAAARCDPEPRRPRLRRPPRPRRGH